MAWHTDDGKALAPTWWNGDVATDFGYLANVRVAVHPRSLCRKPCPFHAPSGHHMVDWKMVYRPERDIVERICEHGIGHPDPDSLHYQRFRNGDTGVHGCDGCCREPDDQPPETD